jgi:hypothetical protein
MGYFNPLSKHKISPCLDCQNRHPACHDLCDQYKQFRNGIKQTRDEFYSTRENAAYFAQKAIERKQKYFDENKMGKTAVFKNEVSK